MKRAQISKLREYAAILLEIKKRVQEVQLKAMLAVNTELIMLYWEIGRIIDVQQKMNGWGAGVIEKLAEDLQKTFPGIGGFSRRNIFRIQAFYAAYEKVPQAVAQICVGQSKSCA